MKMFRPRHNHFTALVAAAAALGFATTAEAQEVAANTQPQVVAAGTFFTPPARANEELAVTLRAAGVGGPFANNDFDDGWHGWDRGLIAAPNNTRQRVPFDSEGRGWGLHIDNEVLGFVDPLDQGDRIGWQAGISGDGKAVLILSW